MAPLLILVAILGFVVGRIWDRIPGIIVCAHRAACRRYWRWRSCNRGGRPRIGRDLRDLIQRISLDNPLWGAPRIHGELLMLGFRVSQSTVSRYMVRRIGRPAPGWKSFLLDHADAIVAIDMFTAWSVVTEQLYAFVVLGHGRRQILHIEVTTHPTALWLANQITEAFPWDTAPGVLIRDNDHAYGIVFCRRVRAMGIRDKPTTPYSPWQNGHAERLIGSIRRECLDYKIIYSAAHLRRVLRSYAKYYNCDRTHLSLAKDCPVPRSAEPKGTIVARPILGGLHHRYERILPK